MLKKTTSQQDYETTSFFKRRKDAKTQSFFLIVMELCSNEVFKKNNLVKIRVISWKNDI